MAVTPTIGQSFPTIQEVNDTARVHLNDTFAGADGIVGSGRVYTNDWTPNITVLNVALDHLRRDLTNRGVPTTREVTFIIDGITPVNGSQGLGVPDPTVQVYLSFGGYWDGSVLNTDVQLPNGLITPLKIAQRMSGTNNPFVEVPPAVDGLPSVYQSVLLGWWEWRQDQIFFNGSINPIDIQLTFKSGFPHYPTNLDPAQYATTYIPVLDSLEALSYRVASTFSDPRVPVGATAGMVQNYQDAMVGMANQWVQTMQRNPASRMGFGDDSNSAGLGISGQGTGWGW